ANADGSSFDILVEELVICATDQAGHAQRERRSATGRAVEHVHVEPAEPSRSREYFHPYRPIECRRTTEPSRSGTRCRGNHSIECRHIETARHSRERPYQRGNGICERVDTKAAACPCANECHTIGCSDEKRCAPLVQSERDRPSDQRACDVQPGSNVDRRQRGGWC